MIGEKTKAQSRSQRERFDDAARALECDESEERFDAALKKVAAHKPPSDEKQKERKKKDERA
jgi:hypothetical protein